MQLATTKTNSTAKTEMITISVWFNGLLSQSVCFELGILFAGHGEQGWNGSGDMVFPIHFSQSVLLALGTEPGSHIRNPLLSTFTTAPLGAGWHSDDLDDLVK